MDLQKIILELQSERNRLDQAIQALERLSPAHLPRRGRPPRWLKERQPQPAHVEPSGPAGPPGKKKSPS